MCLGNSSDVTCKNPSSLIMDFVEDVPVCAEFLSSVLAVTMCGQTCFFVIQTVLNSNKVHLLTYFCSTVHVLQLTIFGKLLLGKKFLESFEFSC